MFFHLLPFPIKIKNPVSTCFQGDYVFFNLAKAYRALQEEHGERIPALALYKAARRAWVMAECKQKRAKFAAIVYQGIVVEVYEVQSWQPVQLPGQKVKAEFTGNPITGHQRAQCVGQSAAPHMPRGAGFVVAYNFTC